MYLTAQSFTGMTLSEVESLLSNLNAYSNTSVVQFFQAKLVPYSTIQQVIRLEFKVFSLGRPLGMMTTVDPGNGCIEVLYWSYATSKIHLFAGTLPDDFDILNIFKNLENLGSDPDVNDLNNHYRYPTDLLEFLGITEEEDDEDGEDEDDEDYEEEEYDDDDEDDEEEEYDDDDEDDEDY